MNIEQLQRDYPNPQKATPGVIQPKGTYCVGGAMMEALDIHAVMTNGPAGAGHDPALHANRGRVSGFQEQTPYGVIEIVVGNFPAPEEIARGLQAVNPMLTDEESLAYGETISRKNDTGNFQTAWRLMGEAFDHVPLYRPAFPEPKLVSV